jgi:hypothetical protein
MEPVTEVLGKSKMICESCGYEIREGTKHRGDGEGRCQVVQIDTELVVGWTNRKQARDMYRKR